jgi:hypothetical protein
VMSWETKNPENPSELSRESVLRASPPSQWWSTSTQTFSPMTARPATWRTFPRWETASSSVPTNSMLPARIFPPSVPMSRPRAQPACQRAAQPRAQPEALLPILPEDLLSRPLPIQPRNLPRTQLSVQPRTLPLSLPQIRLRNLQQTQLSVQPQIRAHHPVDPISLLRHQPVPPQRALNHHHPPRERPPLTLPQYLPPTQRQTLLLNLR